jgi:hypothetical protein
MPLKIDATLPPSTQRRLQALDRDVRAFHTRVDKVADNLPLLPDTDKQVRAKVAPLFRKADELEHRADSLRAAIEKHDSQAGSDALAGALAVLNSGHFAARTVTQRTLIGEHQHAANTFSEATKGSEASRQRWQSVAGDQDLPNTRIVGRLERPDMELVADRLNNTPARAYETTDALGTRAVLFSGKLTDVWGYRSLKDVHPRGWPEGATWDEVPGAGSEDGFAANAAKDDPSKAHHHSSTSLSLHEYGHTVDYSLARPQEERLSDGDRFRRGGWREMRKRQAPGAYLKNYSEEWFAESFARYTKSPQSSAALARWYPETYDFLRRELGAPQFDR